MKHRIFILCRKTISLLQQNEQSDDGLKCLNIKLQIFQTSHKMCCLLNYFLNWQIKKNHSD